MASLGRRDLTAVLGGANSVAAISLCGNCAIALSRGSVTEGFPILAWWITASRILRAVLESMVMLLRVVGDLVTR